MASNDLFGGNSGELKEFTAFPSSVRARINPQIQLLSDNLLKGWRVEDAADPAAKPDLEMLTGRDERIVVRGRWVGPAYTVEDPADVACSFIAEVLKAQANELTEGLLCVHSAAVVMHRRAVLLLGGFRTGKSTLGAVLASRGFAIIGDDAVFISPRHATVASPGIAPRLRLPLPPTLAPDTRKFLQKTAGLTGGRYQYLSLPGDSLLANGEETAVGALVFLKRVPEQVAALTVLPKSEALKALVWQNFARQTPAGRILSSLSELVMSRPTFALAYGEAEEAADTLQETFAEWPSTKSSQFNGKFGDLRRPQTFRKPHWRRSLNVEEQQIDRGSFIADNNTGRIFHLNVTAAAIWKMLSAGHKSKDVLSTISDAFPDTNPSRIGQDVEEMVMSFREHGLLLRADECAAAAES